MSHAAAAEPLAPEEEARLAEFARACKAAQRAVSLYPAGHPGVQTSLGRLQETAARITAGGALNLQVLPDTLLVDGRGPARPDPAVTELAALLHRHLVGRFVVHGGTDVDSWRTLLVLLSRAPEELRTDGGIARVWTTVGGPSIEIHEVDYAELLREHAGEAAAIEAILAACLERRSTLELDEALLRALVNLAGDQAKLELLLDELQQRAAAGGLEARVAAVLALIRYLTDYLTRTRPQGAEEAFRLMSRIVGQLSPEMVTQLLAQRGSPQAMVGDINVVGSIVDRAEDRDVAHFVARSVIVDRGPTERLAEAFHALAPGLERQRQLLALAEQEVAESSLGQEESFPELWEKVERMLTSYSDEKYVSADYARELDRARTRPVEVDEVRDDPPERIAAWLGTVSDGSLRTLDQQLLRDLLVIETDPTRWRDLADLVLIHVADLVRVGYFDLAEELVEAVAHHAEEEGRSSHRAAAVAALERAATGPLLRHALVQIRTASDEDARRIARVCHRLGPLTIPMLAEVFSTEQDARARRRLRDILIGFGARGRDAVRQLMNADNWEVRRTAAYLLREFGGAESLEELEPLLQDTEPLVQREAVRALLAMGDEAAYSALARALETTRARSRASMLRELTAVRDEGVAPFCVYLLRHVDHRRLTDVYLTAIVTLGTLGGPGAIQALRGALDRGEWWAPLRTRAIRTAAARALARLGSPEALEALRDAAARGARGVRAVARRVLAHPGARSR